MGPPKSKVKQLSGGEGEGPPIAPNGWKWRRGTRPQDMYFYAPSGHVFRSRSQLHAYLSELTVEDAPSPGDFRWRVTPEEVLEKVPKMPATFKKVPDEDDCSSLPGPDEDDYSGLPGPLKKVRLELKVRLVVDENVMVDEEVDQEILADQNEVSSFLVAEIMSLAVKGALKLETHNGVEEAKNLIAEEERSLIATVNGAPTPPKLACPAEEVKLTTVSAPDLLRLRMEEVKKPAKEHSPLPARKKPKTAGATRPLRKRRKT